MGSVEVMQMLLQLFIANGILIHVIQITVFLLGFMAVIPKAECLVAVSVVQVPEGLVVLTSKKMSLMKLSKTLRSPREK